MTLQWLRAQARELETLTIDQQLALVRHEQEALEKRVRLIEDLLAAIRRDDLDERREARR